MEVTLRRPPPLVRPLRLRRRDGGAVVHDGDELVAEARPATVALDVPGVVSPALLAWPDGAPDGRKRPAGSALLDGQGAVLAVARTVWVTLS